MAGPAPDALGTLARVGIVGLLVTFLLVALAPTGSGTAMPALVWPAPEFIPREAAANLTTWAAGRLGLAPDPSRSPEWSPENLTFPPAFASPRQKYVHPVLGGNVTAWYLKGGRLHSLAVSGETPYTARSVDLADLEGVANRVAAALGVPLDFTGAGVGIPGSALPPEERLWFLSIDRAQFEPPGDFYSASAAIREMDLRLVSFSTSVWYRAIGAPDLSGADAVAAAFDLARSAFNATAPTGDLGQAYVVNGSGFAYEVYAFWDASSPDLQWFMRAWIDANTGAVVEVEGPRLQPRPIENGATGRLPVGVFLAGVLVAVAVLLALLFFRLTAARALDHFTRGQIYGYIAANPGIHYTAVRGGLGLSNGTLEYHLWVLQRSGFVRSVKEGRLRRLFAEGTGVRSGAIVLSRLQFSILDLVHESGPLPRPEIARRLGLSRQRGHYNLKVLTSLSLVEADPEGRIRLSTAGADFVSGTKASRPGTATAPA